MQTTNDINREILGSASERTVMLIEDFGAENNNLSIGNFY
jgi:hypothetical protein